MSNFKQGGRAMDKEYKVGVDVGSTTVKIVLLDGENNIPVSYTHLTLPTIA